jgi:hypothetical protein
MRGLADWPNLPQRELQPLALALGASVDARNAEREEVLAERVEQQLARFLAGASHGDDRQDLLKPRLDQPSSTGSSTAVGAVLRATIAKP